MAWFSADANDCMAGLLAWSRGASASVVRRMPIESMISDCKNNHFLTFGLRYRNEQPGSIALKVSTRTVPSRDLWRSC
jgi:hypothetical protein